MNRERWEKRDHEPAVRLAKLAEKVGRVADAWLHPRTRERLVQELSDLEFIARCWREQIERGEDVT